MLLVGTMLLLTLLGLAHRLGLVDQVSDFLGALIRQFPRQQLIL